MIYLTDYIGEVDLEKEILGNKLKSRKEPCVYDLFFNTH